MELPARGLDDIVGGAVVLPDKLHPPRVPVAQVGVGRAEETDRPGDLDAQCRKEVGGERFRPAHIEIVDVGIPVRAGVLVDPVVVGLVSEGAAVTVGPFARGDVDDPGRCLTVLGVVAARDHFGVLDG